MWQKLEISGLVEGRERGEDTVVGVAGKWENNSGLLYTCHNILSSTIFRSFYCYFYTQIIYMK